MKNRRLTPGEVLYFYPEELSILVVMVGDNGIRYIEPMNLQFDDNGNIITSYITYTSLDEWTQSLGSIDHISESLTGKQSY